MRYVVTFNFEWKIKMSKIERNSAMATIRRDALDELNLKIDSLCANLTMICGGGFESFSGCSANVQDSYLFGCEQLANECRELLDV
jgi:hypothetical protein